MPVRGRVPGFPVLHSTAHPISEISRGNSMRSFLPPILFLFAALAPAVSRADIPEPDKAFLDEAIPILRQETAKATGGPQNESGVMAGVRNVLVERRKMLTELGEKHSLTDLPGIATQDEYDAEVMTGLRQIVEHGAQADTTRPSPAALAPIQGALESLPPLGKQPVPFMVLGYSELAIAKGDSLVAHGTPAGLVDHVILGKIAEATDLAIKEGEGFFGDSAARSLRQELVLARIRCPKDHAIYKLNAMKNQVKDDGGISTLYYLQCSTCGDPRVIEFPQELASRLNRMAEKQKQAKPGVPAPTQVVQP